MTGAAGVVGSLLRPLLRSRFSHLLLTDLREVADLAGNESFRRGDIGDPAFVEEVVAGADGVIHLAGKVGPNFTFDEVLGPNIAGTSHVLAAAARHGARVVYASSHHAVGFHDRGAALDHRTAPRPDSFYGLSKAFGESAASYYADRHGLGVLVIRIGYVGDVVPDERRLHLWISPRDLAQLIEIGLRLEGAGCETVYGVSDCPAAFFDNSNAARLGYRPLDRAADNLASPDILNAVPDPATPAGRCVGGHFTVA